MSERLLRRGALAAAALVALCCGGTPDPVDLVIRGGTIVDGSGASPLLGDVAIRDGRIVAVGRLGRTVGRREVRAEGLWVAPGFVDLHSHADLILLGERALQEQLLSARLLQGVTTLVVGNCGLGVAPSDEVSAPTLERVNAWMTPDGVHPVALDTQDYLDRLDSRGVAINVGTLVPHGPLRISAMGLRAGAPSAEELASMRDRLSGALEAGALGLSTGLIYPPGMYSATTELIELARIVSRSDRLFTAHVRGSSETLLQATAELIEIARGSGARVHHSHLEAVGERFWPEVHEVLRLEDAARAEGLRVSHDMFPYDRAATMMSAIFPPWSLEGGVEALLQRLSDPQTRERIRVEVERSVPVWPPWRPGGWPHNLVGAVGWGGILIAGVGPGGPQALLGRDLAAIARAEGRAPFDVVADLMLSESGNVGQLVAQVSGDETHAETLWSILAHPSAAVIADAEDYGQGNPHPAHAGAFVRALRLARDERLLTMAEMVRRMSSYPASLVGLDDRGTIRPGSAADLVVFDPLRVSDRASWSEPRRTAEGITFVVLNGEMVVEEGRYLGGLHGRVLRAEPGSPGE